MSYAGAAHNGNRQDNQKKYLNSKMVTCWSKDVALDDLVEALYKRRFLEKLTALQKVKYGRMYALASEDDKVLDELAVNGLDVKDLHLEFTYHKGRQLSVYVTNIPFGISLTDMSIAFSRFGTNFGAKRIKKKFHGFELFTGDWIITYDKLTSSIPSYVSVRGWWAYVKYDGQESTCRKCSKSGHMAANCPQRQKKEFKPEETSQGSKEQHQESENMETNEMPPTNEPNPTEDEIRSTPSMQEENPDEYEPLSEDLSFSSACQEILGNLEMPKDELSHVTVEDCQIPTEVESEDQLSEETPKSQAWADATEDSSVNGSEKPQEKEAKAKPKVGPTVYCPTCRVDSHTEEQCGKVAFIRQTAKRKLGKRDSKLSRGESMGKKRKNIQGFRIDIESIVARGNRGSDVQYILKRDDLESLCALWLVSRFGHRVTALSVKHLHIAGNTGVMDLWTQYSGENMSKSEADELLMKAYERC